MLGNYFLKNKNLKMFFFFIFITLVIKYYILYNSCKRVGDKWIVAMNKWQTLTDMEVCKGKLFYYY